MPLAIVEELNKTVKIKLIYLYAYQRPLRWNKVPSATYLSVHFSLVHIICFKYRWWHYQHPMVLRLQTGHGSNGMILYP